MGQVVEKIQELILAMQGLPGDHQSGPHVRVLQHTAESKERITECIDEEIVDAARSASVARDPWRFFGAAPDHDRRSRARTGCERNGRGRWRRTRSQSLHQSSDRALEFLENLCRLASQQSQVRKTALFDRRSSLSRSCSTRRTTRATWMKKSVTRNVPAVF